MTVQEAKAKLVSWCEAQLGYTEGANNWNKYAPLWTQAGGWNAQNQPWCDVFADTAYIECFGLGNAAKMTYQSVGGFSALCSRSAQFYKNSKAWYTVPEIGDQIFFYDSNGEINHTGIVTYVHGGVVTSIEGNKSDKVQKCSYGVSTPSIAGYGRPDWSVVVKNATVGNSPVNYPSTNEPVAAPAVETCTFTVTLPVVKYGDKGEYVKLMQQRLIAKGYSCGVWGADGDYGNGTKAALLKFQKEKNLEQDGVCGKQTWPALFM